MITNEFYIKQQKWCKTYYFCFMLLKLQYIKIFVILLLVFNTSLLISQNNKPEESKIDSIKQLIDSNINDSIRIHALISISQLYSNSDIKKSILYAEEALTLARSSNNKSLLEFAVFNAGNSCFYHGMYDRASTYFYEYLEAQKTKDNKIGIAYAYSNIGAIRLKMNDLDYAKRNFLQALHILEPQKENEDVISKLPNIYNNIGIVYEIQENYDSSLWYYNKALKYSGFVTDSESFQSSIYNNIGGLYLNFNHYDSAYTALEKAMDIRIRLNDKAGQASSHGKLGDYFQQKGNQIETKNHFYAGFKLAQEIGSIDMISLFSEKLYLYFVQKQKPDSALKYFEKFVLAKEEINQSETFKELTRLELTSRFKEKEKLAKLEQRKIQQTYLFISIILVLFLLVFILLFYLKNNRLKRVKLEKNNFELAAENANLEKENLEKELEIRNKELTTHVMGMIKKNETISHLVEILSNNLSQQNEDLFQGIIKDLNKLQDDTVWEEFEIRYQQVHNLFYTKLHHACPNLSTNERRLCAFLRLNMTTKDIASITGQSLRSIEVARTRLRKKLQITNSDISLVEYLNSL